MNRELEYRAWDTKRKQMYYSGDYWLPALDNTPTPSAANCYPIIVTSAGIIFSKKLSKDEGTEVTIRHQSKTIDCVSRWEYDALSTFNIVLMQFTGLKDKEESDVYYGDILQTYYDDGRMGHIGKLIFGKYGPLLKTKTATVPLYVYPSFEILGNVHQNPELLEK